MPAGIFNKAKDKQNKYEQNKYKNWYLSPVRLAEYKNTLKNYDDEIYFIVGGICRSKYRSFSHIGRYNQIPGAFRKEPLYIFRNNRDGRYAVSYTHLTLPTT